MGITLKFRDLLPPQIANELDHLTAGIRGVFFTEHNSDGTHGEFAGNVVADGYGTFRNQPQAFVTLGGPLFANSGSELLLEWDRPTLGRPSFLPGAGWDKGGLFNPTLGSRLYAPIDGLYHVVFHVKFQAGAGGTREARLKLDGCATPNLEITRAASAPSATEHVAVNSSITLPLKKGQAIALYAYQDSGSGLNVLAGFDASWMLITKIG